MLEEHKLDDCSNCGRSNARWTGSEYLCRLCAKVYDVFIKDFYADFDDK